MPILPLEAAALRISIDPDSLGFSDTSELCHLPLSWIGQQRAETAAYFGLSMVQPDYHLFVLGEVGSGRTSLLHQAMLAVAADRPTPPDVCYLYNFSAPEKPLALTVPTGQGRLLRQALQQLSDLVPRRADVRTVVVSGLSPMMADPLASYGLLTGTEVVAVRREDLKTPPPDEGTVFVDVGAHPHAAASQGDRP